MPIPRIDFFDFRFGGGRGVKKDQVDWVVPDTDADAYVQSLATSGVLPSGSSVKRALRWNATTSSWEAFSSVDTWYYALTVDNSLAQIPAAIIEALTSGFSPALTPGNYQTTYATAAEVVIGRFNLPYYLINGTAGGWESRAEPGAIAAHARFNVDDVYSWIFLPVDVAGAAALTRFWSVSTLQAVVHGGRLDQGILESGGVYGRLEPGGTPRVLLIDGTEYWAMRAALHWEAGTVNHNFQIVYTPAEDTPTVEWAP